MAELFKVNIITSCFSNEIVGKSYGVIREWDNKELVVPDFIQYCLDEDNVNLMTAKWHSGKQNEVISGIEKMFNLEKDDGDFRVCTKLIAHKEESLISALQASHYLGCFVDSSTMPTIVINFPTKLAYVYRRGSGIQCRKDHEIPKEYMNGQKAEVEDYLQIMKIV